jgi:soluble lytic murein transglycosylase-like protein
MTPTTKLLLLVTGAILLGCSTGDPYVPEKDPVLIRANRKAQVRADVIVVDSEEQGKRVFPNIENFLENSHPALALYREEVTRQRVVDFFVERTGAESTALPILYYADRLDIPLTLAFSLVYVESRFRPVAVNYNSTSVDRGLFQLNSLTFRHLREDDFFNPEVNAFHGLKYLEFCLNQGRNDEEALAIYNAGLTRVVRGQTPASTLRYVDKIVAYRAGLVAEFKAYILSHFPPAIA